MFLFDLFLDLALVEHEYNQQSNVGPFQAAGHVTIFTLAGPNHAT